MRVKRAGSDIIEGVLDDGSSRLVSFGEKGYGGRGGDWKLSCWMISFAPSPIDRVLCVDGA